MAKKKPEGKKYSYMDTYGDLVTLLLCFFVLLFAMSTVEETKFNAFVTAMTERFGANENLISNAVETDGTGLNDTPADGEVDQTPPAEQASLENLKQEVEQYIEEHNLEGQVSVEQGESSTTFIRLSANMLFSGNSSDLRPETREFLDFLAQSFNKAQEQIVQVKFHGHTATAPGSGVDDWELSGARASKVSSYFENNGAFNRFKIGFSGYGRNYPIADNNTAEGMARNRRVDIVVMGDEASVLDAMRVYFPSDDTSFFEGDPQDLPENMFEDMLPGGMTEEELRRLYQRAQQSSSG